MTYLIFFFFRPEDVFLSLPLTWSVSLVKWLQRNNRQRVFLRVSTCRPACGEVFGSSGVFFGAFGHLATAPGFFPLSGLCGLHSLPRAAAVLCLPPWSWRQQWRRVCCAFLAAEMMVGGGSISVLERINPSCSGGEESLSLSRWC